MTLANGFLLLIALGAALGVVVAVRQWYRSCEQKYAPLFDPQVRVPTEAPPLEPKRATGVPIKLETPLLSTQRSRP
ncbi:MAG: hypothetical protein M3124_10105 [Actinomycetota bacterium]|nr:hypothetical protein [Actinomycetota bacterium]